MSDDVVGLELGSGSLKVALVRDGMPITVASQALPQGVFSRGTLMKPQALTHATKALCQKAHLPTKAVRISVPDPRIQVRSTVLPDLGDRDELLAALRLNASAQFDAMDLTDAALDYQPIRTDEKRVEVSMTATPKAVLAPVVGAIGKAGLKVIGIETPTTALARVLALPAGPPTLVVLIDGDITHVALVESRAISYAHTFALGTWDFWEPLIGAGFAVREAAQLSSLVGVGGEPDRSLSPALVSDVHNHLLVVFDRFVSQLDDAIDLVRALGRAPAENLVVMGDGARIRGLADSIAQYLPSAGQLLPAGLSGGMARSPEPERYAVCLGLSAGQGPNLIDFKSKARAKGRAATVREIDSSAGTAGARARTKQRSLPKPYLVGILVAALGLAGMSYMSGPLNQSAQEKEQEIADIEVARTGAGGAGDMALKAALTEQRTLSPLISQLMSLEQVAGISIGPKVITMNVRGSAEEAMIDLAAVGIRANATGASQLSIPVGGTP